MQCRQYVDQCPYCRYYFAKAVKAPHLYFKDGPFARLVQTHCTTLLQPFLPTPWAFSGHTQTMLGGKPPLFLHFSRSMHA